LHDHVPLRGVAEEPRLADAKRRHQFVHRRALGDQALHDTSPIAPAPLDVRVEESAHAIADPSRANGAEPEALLGDFQNAVDDFVPMDQRALLRMRETRLSIPGVSELT